jgi:hypothetical protein
MQEPGSLGRRLLVPGGSQLMRTSSPAGIKKARYRRCRFAQSLIWAQLRKSPSAARTAEAMARSGKRRRVRKPQERAHTAGDNAAQLAMPGGDDCIHTDHARTACNLTAQANVPCLP